MAQQFKDQGGAASMDPSNVYRWLTSRMMTRICKPGSLQKKRATAEAQRVKAGLPHVVDYFHQVDDGYSHLAIQLLQPLLQRYNIELVCHLVPGPEGKNAPEPELLINLSRHDSAAVASHYGLNFPQAVDAPPKESLALCQAALAGLSPAEFIAHGAQLSEALWSGDTAALQSLADQLGVADAALVESKLQQGKARRKELKHYSGAMFHYGGEWYWGADRLYHLEQRLAELGADQQSGQPLLVPRPAIEAGPLKDNGSLTLEFYPSLRSPYTSLIFDKTVEFTEQVGVKLALRPVLPMVMRGVPATREKGFYIFTDAAREARALGLDWGKFYDTIGEPVRRCYSLYPWAVEQGKGTELLGAFLRAAFFEGQSTNSDRGLRKVVERAGLDWNEASKRLGKPGWEDLLEANRLAMYEFGSWGVPSYRLLDEQGNTLLALWGQDRLWLFARVIQEQLAQRQGSG
jgi:2-hydroxychromene-2-carboxylate isomerase